MSKNKTETNSGFLDFPLYAISENDSSAIEIRGEGKKGILILTKTDDIEKVFAFITAVLSPLSVKTEDILLLNTTTETTLSFSTIGRKYDFNTLIILGLSPKDVGLQVQAQLYQTFELSGKKILFAEKTTTYVEEKEKGDGRPKAKQLWLCLKSLHL